MQLLLFFFYAFFPVFWLLMMSEVTSIVTLFVLTNIFGGFLQSPLKGVTTKVSK
jgi:hypothetical protein